MNSVITWVTDHTKLMQSTIAKQPEMRQVSADAEEHRESSLERRHFWNVPSLVALALVLAPLTTGAIGALPMFDDAWNWLYFKEKGTDFLTGLPDRPVMGYVWTVLSLSEEAFWKFNFVAHAVLWGGFAISAALLWRHLLPNLAHYGWVIACLTIAPFGFHVQTMLASIVLGCLLSIVLAYAAFLLVLRFVKASDAVGLGALVLSQLLLGTAILFMEYAFSVVAVMTVLMLVPAVISPDAGERSRTYRAVLLSIVVAVMAYGVYYVLAEWRSNANPGIMYTHPPIAKELGVMFVVKMAQAVWQGMVGNLALSLSEIRLTAKSSLLAAAYGFVVGGLLVAGTRPHRDQKIDHGTLIGPILLLGIALLAGLLPVIYSGRLPWSSADGTTSRFGMPVLPIIAMLLVLIVLSLVRQRLWAIPVFLFGFAAGDTAFSEGWHFVQERQDMAVMGEAVRPHLSDQGGVTVAVIATPTRKFGPPRQWELTARLSADWPPAQREKFWAFRYGGNPPLTFYTEEASLLFGTRAECKIPKEADFGTRLIQRKGPLDRFLWVERRPDETIAVEPFCLKDAQNFARPALEGR
jgi:hypothetical protein